MIMSSELKMVLITFIAITVGILAFIWGNNLPECHEVKYQDLSGTHSKTECHTKDYINCWDNYTTEHEAIKACEGK